VTGAWTRATHSVAAMIAMAGQPRMQEARLPPAALPDWWDPGAMALLLVDLQQGTCGDAQPRPRPAFDVQFRAQTLPAARRALEAARQAGLEVIHTVIANLTADGRDRSLDYKRCDMGFAPGSRAAQVIPELAPRADELVLPKSSSSLWVGNAQAPGLACGPKEHGHLWLSGPAAAWR